MLNKGLPEHRLQSAPQAASQMQHCQNLYALPAEYPALLKQDCSTSYLYVSKSKSHEV